MHDIDIVLDVGISGGEVKVVGPGLNIAPSKAEEAAPAITGISLTLENTVFRPSTVMVLRCTSLP